jgi:hypothetical protein
MNKQMFALMQRRGELLARISAQREQVAEIGRRWQAPLALVDKGLTAVRFLRSKPMLVAGTIAIFVIRRRGVTGMLATAWRIWRLYKSAILFSKKMAPHLRH